jgi:acetaldehyde dehydrogenase
VEVIGGAKAGKAIIILNPAEPPLVMRDTIYCSLPAGSDEAKVAQSIQDMVDEVQTYVPGYRLRGEPQFDRLEDGTGRVATFIEVEGAGDYLPPYSGNLDIMTAAATKVGDEMARELLAAEIEIEDGS